jgi:hypothetical protein
MHPFDILLGLYPAHGRLLFEKVHPSLAALVILQEILEDKAIPGITLEKVQTFVKPRV